MTACDVLLLSDYAGQGEAAGGAGIAISASFTALRQAGVSVRLLTGFGAGADSESLGGHDLRGGSPADALRIVYNRASRAALATALTAVDPDRTIVVLHSWTRYLTPSALGLLRNFRTMIVMHDYFWACPNGSYFNFRREQPCALTPGGLACMTTQCDRAGYGHKLARIIRHGIRTAAVSGARYRPIYAHVSRRARAVALPLLPDGDHVVVHNPLPPTLDGAATPRQTTYDVGYFGRLEPQKGLDALTAALTAGGRSGLFVGEGRLSGRIDAEPAMTRLGWQSHAEAIALMRQCRAVALPSLWPETWGLITAEAMAAGVRVIVSTRAGSAELVEAFGGGLIFDPADPSSLARVLDHVGSVPILPPATLKALRSLLSPQEHVAALRRAAVDSWGVTLQNAPPTGVRSLAA